MTLPNYGLVNSLEEFAKLARLMLGSSGPISVDCETGYLGPDRDKASLAPETATLVGISFTISREWARYIPLAHDSFENLDNREAARIFWPVLNSGRCVAHNAVMELRHLSKWIRAFLWDDPDYGAEVRASNGYFPMLADTQVEAYLVAEHQRFGLKYLTKQLFGHSMTEIHELFENLAINKRKSLRFNVLGLTPKVVEYACEDAVWCLAIHERYYPRVKDMFLFRVEMGVLQCVCEMEDHGIRYDWGYLRRGAAALTDFRDRFNAEIMAELTEILGVPMAVNLASPVQVYDVLYNRLGLRTSVYTASTKDKPSEERRMSTGAIALTTLSKQYPVVKRILQWKEMSKLLGTYLGAYEEKYAFAADGNVHPNHMSAVVVTGRFAVSDPNYQASPKEYHYDLEPARRAHEAHVEAHGEKCRCAEFAPPAGTCFRFNFRDAVIAPKDHYILGFDLSQAELRAIAGEAQERALLEAFESGVDVHTKTAALMLRIPIEQVTPKLRKIGKTMNFALGYGMGVKGLADRLGIDVDEAQDLFEKYSAAYPALAVWKEKQVRFGQTHGYVMSRFGRKLPIWEYASEERWIRSKGDRACVNYPIQGAATGDMVKTAMVRARAALRKAALHDRVRLVMNVHDALEFYVHKSVDPAEVIKVLEPAVIFSVPGWPAMKADWHLGRSWGSPKEIEVRADGRLIVKEGKREIELTFYTEEEDEETGEMVPVLPEVDVDVLRDAVAAARAPARETKPRRLIVELTEMPAVDRWQRFKQLLADSPGPNTLTLRTPEGDLDIDLDRGTSLTPADTARVSMLLGVARLIYDAADIDTAELVQGLTL